MPAPYARRLMPTSSTFESTGPNKRPAARWPEARPPMRARTSEPADVGDQAGTVSSEVGVGVPLAFLATATEAVHHRCITSTAFGGLPRDRRSTLNRMVKPNSSATRLVGRRIRLTGLLTESPANAGFSYSGGETACITVRCSGSAGRSSSGRRFASTRLVARTSARRTLGAPCPRPRRPGN
jgi:hypothetical protein